MRRIIHGHIRQHLRSLSRQDVRLIMQRHQASMQTAMPMPHQAFSTEVPKKAMGFHPPIHRLLYASKTTIEEVFAVLASRVSPYDSKGSDSFFYKCLQHDSLRPSFVQDVVAYFDSFLRDDPEGPSDGTMASAVALLIKHGRVDHALAALEVRRARFPHAPLHFRVYSPFLEHYIDVGDLAAAWSFWESIKSSSIHLPPDTVGPTLASFALVALQQQQPDNDTLVRNLMHDLHELRYHFTPAEAAKWEAQLHRPTRLPSLHLTSNNADKPTNRWSVTRLALQCPVCTQCGDSLDKLKVLPTETTRLLEVVRAMCTAPSKFRSISKSSKPTQSIAAKEKSLGEFEAWLTRRHAQVAPGKMHYIVDGPNVAYLNQNFQGGAFRFDYVDRTIAELEADGHVVSVTMPSIYFDEVSMLSIKATTASRRQRKEGKFFHRTRTNSDKAFLDKWEARDLTFKCRREVAPDDLYWLYASVYLASPLNNVRVVTNDIMRDHIVVLAEQFHISRDLIDRWRDSAIVGVRILDRNLKPDDDVATINPGGLQVEILETLPYSLVVQGHGDPSYHIPVAAASSADSEWLCLTRG